MWKGYKVAGGLLALLAVLDSCASGGAAGSAVLDHQRELAEYQAAVDSFVGRAGECADEIERIRGRADGITGTVDETILLFEQYQRAVDKLIQEYRELERKVGEDKDRTPVSGVYIDTAGDTEGGGIYPVLQGDKGSTLA